MGYHGQAIKIGLSAICSIFILNSNVYAHDKINPPETPNTNHSPVAPPKADPASAIPHNPALPPKTGPELKQQKNMNKIPDIEESATPGKSNDPTKIDAKPSENIDGATVQVGKEIIDKENVDDKKVGKVLDKAVNIEEVPIAKSVTKTDSKEIILSPKPEKVATDGNKKSDLVQKPEKTADKKSQQIADKKAKAEALAAKKAQQLADKKAKAEALAAKKAQQLADKKAKAEALAAKKAKQLADKKAKAEALTAQRVEDTETIIAEPVQQTEQVVNEPTNQIPVQPTTIIHSAETIISDNINNQNNTVPSVNNFPDLLPNTTDTTNLFLTDTFTNETSTIKTTTIKPVSCNVLHPPAPQITTPIKLYDNKSCDLKPTTGVKVPHHSSCQCAINFRAN